MSKDIGNSVPTINEAMQIIARTLHLAKDKLIATRRAISGPYADSGVPETSKEPYLFESMAEIGRLAQDIDEIAGTLAADFGAMPYELNSSTSATAFVSPPNRIYP